MLQPVNTVSALKRPLPFLPFAILFSALIGNAQISGIDLFSAIIAPAIILYWAVFGESTQINKRGLYGLMVSSIFMTVILLKASTLTFPFDYIYWLWPIKIMILATMIALAPNVAWTWHDHLALCLFALPLLLMADIENGRMSSVFGPNMLYRIFGAVYVLSLFLFFKATGRARLIYYATALIAALSVLATGSTGGLLVLALPFLFVRQDPLQFVKVLAPIILLTPLYLVLKGVQFSDITSVGRLLYKIGQLENQSRFIGNVTLLSEPFAFFGHSYQKFLNVWSHGYDYPHNIFVELYIYFGAPGILLSIVTVWFVFAGYARLGVLYFGGIVILLGALLSGELSENFGVIAFAIGAANRRVRDPKVAET